MADARISIDDFAAYMPGHNYIFKPTRELWLAPSVNARIGPVGKMHASAWLDVNRPIEQMTWAPGEPKIIEGRLISEGGWIKRPGSRCFNLYRPPIIDLGDENAAEPWLDLVRMLYPTWGYTRIS